MAKEKIIECMTGKTVEQWEKNNAIIDKMVKCSTCGNETEYKEYGTLCADNECWCEKED